VTTIRERHIADVTLLDVEGRISNEDDAAVLRAAFDGLVRQGRLKLAVNLQLVPSLDTVGLCELLRAYTSVTRRGGALKLLNLAPHVRQVLVVTRLLPILEAFDTEAAALESLEKASAQRDMTAR
jgi:anti-sigma B factor antagonist